MKSFRKKPRAALSLAAAFLLPLTSAGCFSSEGTSRPASATSSSRAQTGQADGSSDRSGSAPSAGASASPNPEAASAQTPANSTVVSPPVDANDPWRPLTHYTPKNNWMNDPNGLVYHKGEYHLFYQYNPKGSDWGNMSWGHAVSSDLVHWKEQGVAIPGTDQYGVFSGSAVVDARNTSGFGTSDNPPMVAIWTRNDNASGIQSQSLAYSTDNGRTWTLHNGGAPVLDVKSKSFRDPKVFWDEKTKRWTMVLVKADEHKVSFYSSPNLKDWKFESDFGPVGDVSSVWECPDLFPMKVEGESGKTRWVLTVNTSPSAQYFVGDWDGKTFKADSSRTYTGKEGKTLADFEDDAYGSWTTSGSAFGNGPSHATGRDISGYVGSGYVNSYGSGDSDTGTLTSPEFTINANRLNMLIGGGSHPYSSVEGSQHTSVNVVVEGKVVATATGNDSAKMFWQSLDLKKWRGKKARVVIEDKNTSSQWGHITVDQIVLSDTPAFNESVPKVDYGHDYYASVTWEGAPDGKRYAVGWMSNWTYAKEVPTKTWRSAMSTVRELKLRKANGKERLVFSPVSSLNSLRTGGEFKKSDVTIEQGTTPLDAAASGKSLDISLTLDPLKAKESGISVLADATQDARGKTQGTRIGYDAAKQQIFVDRSNSGEVGFSPAFPGRSVADFKPGKDGLVHLRVIVDSSSVEVFADDGKLALTETVYPAAGADKVSLFAAGGEAKARSLSVWHLGSYRQG